MSAGTGAALENTSTSEVDWQDIKMDGDENIELVKLQEENVNLATEVQLLKIQLSKTLQLTEQMQILNQKNLRLSSELSESSQKVESLQQRLKHTQDKNTELTAKNKELTEQLHTLECNNNIMNDKLTRVDEHETHAQTLVRQLQQSNEEMLTTRKRFLDECSSIFTETCESEETILTILRGMDMSRPAREKKIERDNERVHLRRALKSMSKELDKAQTKAKQESKNNSALQRGMKEMEEHLKQLQDQLQETTQKNQDLQKQNEELRKNQISIREKIQQIQADRNEESENYKELIRIRDERIKEMQNNITNPQLDPETLRLVSEVATLKEMNRKLTTTKEELCVEVENLSSKLTTATLMLQKMKNERAMVKSKFGQMRRVQDEITKSNTKLKHENATLQKNIEENKQEIRVLAEKIKSLQTKKEPSEQFLDGAEVFEPLLTQQKMEIETLSRERQKLFEVVNKQTGLMITTERVLEDQRRTIEDFKKKMNVMAKKLQNPTEAVDVAKLIPVMRSVFVAQLNEPLRSTIDAILEDQEMDPREKLRRIGATISKTSPIESSESRLSDLSLLTIEPGQKLYPSSLATLFEGTAEERMEFIKKLRTERIGIQDALKIIQLFSLVCVSHEKDLKDAKADLAKKSEWFSEYSAAFGDMPVTSLEEKIDKMQGKTKECKSLKNKLREMVDVEKYCSELRRTCSKQEKQIESLKSDMKTLVKDATELQNQLEAQSSQFAKLQQAHESTQSELANQRQKHLQEITEYESVLSKRNQELVDVKRTTSETIVDLEQQLSETKCDNDGLRKNLIKLEEKLRITITKLQETERSMNSRIDAKSTENQAEIQHLEEIQSELKEKLMQTISVMKEQMSDNESLSAELESQKRMCDSAQERVSKLAKANKALDLKVASLTEQMAREKEILTTQFRFQTMSNETKHQQEMNTLKTKCATDLNAIVLTLTEEFEEFADIEVGKCMDIQKAIHRLAHNYRSMRQQIRQ